jgi:hypothetical protein
MLIRKLLIGIATLVVLVAGIVVVGDATVSQAANNSVTMVGPWNCTKGSGTMTFSPALSPIGTSAVQPLVKMAGSLRGCSSSNNPTIKHFSGTYSVEDSVGLPDNNCNFRLLQDGTTPNLTGTITWKTSKPNTTIASSTVTLTGDTYTANYPSDNSATVTWEGGTITSGSFVGSGVFLHASLRATAKTLGKRCVANDGLSSAKYHE